MKSLLTATEARDFSPFRDTYPTCDLNMIATIEQPLFRNVLGWEFYEALQNNLTNFSTAVTWQSGVTYQVNAMVKYNNRYYRALQATTQQPPNVSHWVEAQKFTNDCYNAFWCNYLAPYISLNVYLQYGFIEPRKNHQDFPLSAAQINDQRRGVSNLIEMAKENMFAYVTAVRSDNGNSCYAAFEHFKLSDSANCNATCNGYDYNSVLWA